MDLAPIIVLSCLVISQGCGVKGPPRPYVDVYPEAQVTESSSSEPKAETKKELK